MSSESRTIAIVYNSSHYIYLLRLNLIKRLKNEGYRVIAIAPYDVYSDALQREGVGYSSVSMDNKGTNPVNDIKLVFDLFLIYKKVRPDVILHFTIKPNIYGSTAAQILGIPVINNITGLGTAFLTEGLIQKITKLLYKVSFRKVSKVFFQNNEDRKLFLENNLMKKEKAFLLPGSGVDTKKFSPKERRSTQSSFVFLLIARVIRDKGIFEYVEAARELKESYSNVEFRLLGGLGIANRGAIDIEKVNTWQNANLITYLGSAEDVREHIAKADCIVLPSYREGTSKVLLEAASMAKPIITTNVPGCNNVVVDGENGLLCKVRDSEDLARKMKMMIGMSIEDRMNMGVAGRRKMINEFEEILVIDSYSNAIKETDFKQ